MDNHHVNISQSYASCGILELARIEPEVDKVIYAMATYLYHPSRGQPAAYFLWSGPPEGSNAKALYDALWKVSSNWGAYPKHAVAATDNPKTGNIITIFVWQIPHEQFREWYKAERIRRLKNL